MGKELIMSSLLNKLAFINRRNVELREHTGRGGADE